MKNFGIKTALLFSFLFSFTQVSAEIMTARADIWCPFNCEPNAKYPGILVELMQNTFAKSGYKIDYQTMPWPQAVADVRSGRFNAALGIAGPDAVGMTHTEKPQYISNTCVYTLNNNKKIIKSAAELKTLKSIGTVKDYSYGDISDKVLSSPEMKNKVMPMGTDGALTVNIRRLNDGKIEALLEDSLVMSYQMKIRKINNIKKIGCTEDQVITWIGFTDSNSKSKLWTEELAKTQSELEKSGKMAEIYNHYK